MTLPAKIYAKLSDSVAEVSSIGFPSNTSPNGAMHGCSGQVNIISIDTNNATAPPSRAVTADQEIDEIVRQLSQSLSGKEPIAVKAVLSILKEEIHNMGRNSDEITFLIRDQVLQGGSSGPMSQSLILFAREWLKSTPQEEAQTITQIAKQIASKESTATSDQLMEAILQSATRIFTGGSNNTNIEITKISSLVTQKNTTLFFPTNYVLYQIALRFANVGGNASKAIHRIDSSITQNPMMISFEHLPMVKTLLQLAQLKLNGNINMLNTTIDGAVQHNPKDIVSNNKDIDSNLITYTHCTEHIPPRY